MRAQNVPGFGKVLLSVAVTYTLKHTSYYLYIVSVCMCVVCVCVCVCVVFVCTLLWRALQILAHIAVNIKL